ncbi:MAG: DUF1489 family protein [Marinibacterium sp.]
MDNPVHLVKLCVGTDTVEDLACWQATARTRWPDGLPRHITRMWPKRAEQLLAGGSLFWVFRGQILARQRVLRLDPVTGEDGIARCAIVLEPDLVPTRPQPRRPFQGWRYLSADDAPPDLTAAETAGEALPAPLAAALEEIGVR